MKLNEISKRMPAQEHHRYTSSPSQTDPPAASVAKITGKRIAFSVLAMLLVILTIEAGSQLIFSARNGYFLFQREPREIFNIRHFHVLTNDARGFSAIPGFTNPNYKTGNSTGWFLSFDAFGFRNGKQTASASGQPNIVFIGDSTPFGWGVSDNGSLPSQFFERLQEHSPSFGVVNAALPSYALAQAVARYEQEIHGRMAVDTVYLQIYDPASQLAARGARWQPSDNWTNYPYVSKSFLYRHSAAVVMLAELPSPLNINVGGANSLVETFDPSDAATARRVQVHVRTELERLLAMSKMDGVRHLIVAPTTLPTRSYHDWYSRSRLDAIELVNQCLKDFASAHHNEVIFADTISLLRSYPEADVFIDRCCHLSERGNGIVADYLITLLLNSGHISRNRVVRPNGPAEVSPQPAPGSQPSKSLGKRSNLSPAGG